MSLSTATEQTLLRFSTAGSVDDGKSTLVGRLLYDSKNILEDHLQNLEKRSEKYGGGEKLSLALLTDGLKAEQEQGITIDVAYRYFSTPKRRFVLADSPGHEQYTRNMATGASTADVTIILIDATRGVLAQTKRHAFIASLLGVPRLLVTINKMDLVEYSQDVYEKIRADFLDFSAKLGVKDVRFVPISALRGDNVFTPSRTMPWFHGETVMEYLENVYIGGDKNLIDFRFPVQTVLRGEGTTRIFAGQICSGSIHAGEEVLVLPAMRKSTVRSIDFPSITSAASAATVAFAPQSITITLNDEIDISRGDMIVRSGNVPRVSAQLDAMLVWMAEEPMNLSKTYFVQHTTRVSKAVVEQIRYRVDVNTLSRESGTPLALNEVGRVSLNMSSPLFVDSYRDNRATGSFVLIDPETYRTVAAGMALSRGSEDDTKTREKNLSRTRASNLHDDLGFIRRTDRETKAGFRALTFWCTGLSGSGKSTIANAFERKLFQAGIPVYRLDGDSVRQGLNRDLGFTSDDRRENIRRVAEVAALFNQAGVSVICSFISPFEEDRRNARRIIGEDDFIEIFLDTPLEICEKRDPHGLYRKARSGEIAQFTGIHSPYEAPKNPEITLRTVEETPEQCVERLFQIFNEKAKLKK